MSDDRPKKSWREIDRMRDGGGGRRDDDRPRAERLARAGRGQRAYRAALDRLFESGKIGELVAEQAGPEAATPPADAAARQKLVAAVREAVGRDAITRALDALLAEHPLPRDFEVLSQALEHRDPARQLDAMRLMREMVEAGERPRRARAIVGKLRLIRDTEEEPELVELADALIDELD